MNRILLLLLTIALCFSETILIPEDCQTIQKSIDASVDGYTTTLVTDGIVDILDIFQIINYFLKN